MPRSCVAVGCTNHNLMEKPGLTFHIFPDREKKSDKWKRWVQAMKRVNADGSPWIPKGIYVYICSEHFIEGKPSKDPNHQDFVPSVFKHNPVNKKASKKSRRKRSLVEIVQQEVLLTGDDHQSKSPALIPSSETPNKKIALEPVTGSDKEMPLWEIYSSRKEKGSEKEMLQGEIDSLRKEKGSEKEMLQGEIDSLRKEKGSEKEMLQGEIDSLRKEKESLLTKISFLEHQVFRALFLLRWISTYMQFKIFLLARLFSSPEFHR